MLRGGHSEHVARQPTLGEVQAYGGSVHHVVEAWPPLHYRSQVVLDRHLALGWHCPVHTGYLYNILTQMPLTSSHSVSILFWRWGSGEAPECNGLKSHKQV